MTLGVLPLTGCPEVIPALEWRELQHDNLTRSYAVQIPCNYTGEETVPLVLALHGAGGDGESAAEATEFGLLSEREGFIAVYPNGVGNQWNDGRGVSFGEEDFTHVDDVGFIAALLDGLDAEFAINPSRIYVMGISNGGMMTHRLACELSERFAAAATVIGAIPANLAPICDPSLPVPMLMINGTDDPLVLWQGGFIGGDEAWGELLSVDGTAQFWATHNGCDGQPTRTWLPDRTPFDGERVWRDEYACGTRGEVVFYGIEGGGHSWPDCPTFPRTSVLSLLSRDLCFTEVVWDFFESQTREISTR